ncbi:uncharacterized protein EV420DRAFT_1646466 [Desarmillaria tabescens]|uniref:F-box domain-containing protein n=1 Tax=Armillaria tabescens TaxID=1929756 RepID=A0AA39JXH2_ARMTA|nr:uncharacterized protein EV420DRAFT_1646466 [Desarmillaria tabescens]KAK0450548.1 hypothetical protein EV420DRAFT_1646466 [Desarmillaria tabescens]
MSCLGHVLRGAVQRKKQHKPSALQPIECLVTRTTPRPELPPEIWMLVIRFATCSYPDPLDTSRPVSFLDPPHVTQLRLVTYYATMQQKLALCRVSRQWREWATEFLYEFVWVNRAGHARLLARTLETPEGKGHGRWIRRLHVETMTLDKCNPSHLRTILDASPDLAIYSDHRSIRLTLFSVNSPLEETCTPDDLFQSLPTNLRRLSWTSYEASPTPTMPLFSVLHNLTFLELHFHAPMRSAFAVSSPPPVSPSQTFYLPQLQTLKTSLCSNTFELLSTWILPSLCNLSLISPDFSYSSPGFLAFFSAHGAKINQLELGHSSSNILEEHYITPIRPVTGRPSLASLLPNMTEFICSADAEWNWESPDWIAPHVLLPSHPRLQLIGVRDIGRGNWLLIEQMRSLLRRDAFPSLRYVRDMGPGLFKVRNGLEPDIDMMLFWRAVWDSCGGRGVWLEDLEGVNFVARDWKRLGFDVPSPPPNSV